MLFKYDVKDDLDLSKFKTQLYFYLPKMDSFNVDNIKCTFKMLLPYLKTKEDMDHFSYLQINIEYAKLSTGNKYILTTSLNIADFASSEVFDDFIRENLGKCSSHDTDIIIERIHTMVKFLFKFDKLKAFL